MKIALIGATGFAGSAILQEAVDRGHEVTAIVRHPDTLTSHAKVHPKKADVYNEDEVARLVMGHDAVISAFNPGWRNPDIYNQQVRGTRAISNGVEKTGVTRLLSSEEQAVWTSSPASSPWTCQVFRPNTNKVRWPRGKR
jgi:putative NADH-flavin reductase